MNSNSLLCDQCIVSVIIYDRYQSKILNTSTFWQAKEPSLHIYWCLLPRCVISGCSIFLASTMSAKMKGIYRSLKHISQIFGNAFFSNINAKCLFMYMCFSVFTCEHFGGFYYSWLKTGNGLCVVDKKLEMEIGFACMNV